MIAKAVPFHTMYLKIQHIFRHGTARIYNRGFQFQGWAWCTQPVKFTRDGVANVFRLK